MSAPGLDAPLLRRHQQLALDALLRAWEVGHRRTWVVLPPGAGKTRLGLEAVRHAPGVTCAVVFGPNTAIQSQWERQARSLGIEAGTDRELTQRCTALTYQSLAVFDTDRDIERDPDQDTEDEPSDAAPVSLLAQLHDNGRELVARLREAGPILLILDECHHLLEVWGRLLEELLAELPQASVLGLTATPPEALTADQRDLVDGLFGPVVFETSIPAVVREGDLAPFGEMVWLTTPNEVERSWLRAEAQRFTELTTQLLDPTFGSTGFLTWLDLRFIQREVSWQELERRHPELCMAALRMHHVGLLGLPPGARLAEQHRLDPTPEDWAELIEDWLERGLPGDDEAVRDAVRRALPSVGFQLTRRGIRRGRSPVDRVVARSVSKTQAAVEICVHEHAALGERMRTLVLCDHEQATAILPADLHGVIDQQAGSAQATLGALVEDQVTKTLSPVMVTGRTVAGAPETMARLREYVSASNGTAAADLAIVDLGQSIASLTGSWSSRVWVAHVTRFFQDGHCQILLGTRGLLGEGWDADRITGLVDLTAVTTTTAVVQTRGRALRVDPTWPDKVALNWSVVCVADDHPKAHNDWDRLVRKHRGYLALDENGDVVDGVAHIDAALSPFAPPELSDFDAVNARMLIRAQQREVIAERWRVGEPYDDVLATTLRVAVDPRKLTPEQRAPVVVPTEKGLTVRVDGPPPPSRLTLGLALGFALATGGAGYVSGSWWLLVLGIVVVLAAAAHFERLIASHGRRLLLAAAAPVGIGQVARAVADGLQTVGLVSVGASGVKIEIDHDGRYRCHLEGVSEAESTVFADALDEVVSPILNPRYVVARYVMDAKPMTRRLAWRAAFGEVKPNAQVWHAVPTELGRRAADAEAFAAAWQHWVGGSQAVFTRSPQGTGVLASQRGADPFDATTVMRRHWS